MAGRKLGLPTGVELIGKSIRIRFTWNGERRSETLAHPQTAKGIKAAADLRAQVISLAKHGVLDEKRYAELFPTSSYLAHVNEIMFGEYAQTWLNSLEVVHDPRVNYKGLMNNYWMPHLATLPIKAVTPMVLREVVAKTQWKSSTVKRAAIARVKAMFRAAVYDEVVDRNPAAAIQLPQKNKKQVDPFTVEEADALIAWMYANFSRCNQVFAAFYEFAFYTGMRTGEVMALRWDEIDFDKRTAHVCRIVVEKQVVERTKTKYTRTVMLNSRALGALAKAKEIAHYRSRQKRRVSTESSYVFQPSGSSPYMKGTDTPGVHFNEAIAALKLPARPQYNCRHTYATMCLMSGMNPAFIAGQLGHSVQVLLTTYAKWLNSANDWSELAKLEQQVIGTELVQD
ncbi:site-specific integrase [Pseudomonas sp. SWRI100]|uniref:tyrosine-type recombinase/integrase n=1 Tax=Pseudomonas TaxID=286 RepID=UPI00164444E5|nr:tyrosine-type recombinase/integrase [Pseudomonas sp. SWRI67]MBV4527594.1 site-specific integrase [Pseudomonas kermanshahensis]